MAGDIYFARPSPSVGANLGSSLGQGLALGLMELVDRRLSRMDEREAEKAFEEAGYSKSQAQAFSKLPKEERKSLWKHGAFKRDVDNQQANSFNFFSRFLPQQDAEALSLAPLGVQTTALKALIDRGAFIPESNLASVQMPVEMGQGFGQPERNSPLFDRLNMLRGSQQAEVPAGLQALQNLVPGLRNMSFLPEEPAAQLVPSQVYEQELLTPQKAGIKEILTRPFESETSKNARLSREQSERQFGERQEFAKNKFQTTQATQAYKLFKEDLDQIKNKAEASRKNINTYNQVIKLAESGKLRSGNTYQLLNRIGLQDFLSNPETQLAKKLLSRLAQNAGSAFNTRRLTNLEVSSYKDSLGTLMNTDEGLIAIAKNNLLEEQANIVKDNARKQVMAEAGKAGSIPFDILDRIDELAEPELKRLADEAVSNVNQATAMQRTSKAAPYVGLTIDELPEPGNTPKGAVLQSDDGTIYQNTGSRWVKKGKKEVR